MGKKYQIVAVVLISLCMVAFFLSIYITVDETMPNNAIVVVTHEDRLYHSIHFDLICVEDKAAETKTLSEALAQGYRPHAHCQELGYFKGNRRFLFHHLLSKIGLQVNSRWDRNGNWLW
jgi:hypothetical protein